MNRKKLTTSAINQSMNLAPYSEVDLPVQLMNGGHHFDDVPEAQRRCRGVGIDLSLPRTQLLYKVADSNMHRPLVKHRRT